MHSGGRDSRKLRRHYLMRASQADRDRAVHVLQAAYAEGRLSYEEFGERLGTVLTARSFEDLMDLTADLPAGLFGRLPTHRTTPAPARPRWLPLLLACLLLTLCAALSVAVAVHATAPAPIPLPAGGP